MAIFDSDDSDAGSKWSFSSDSSFESDEEMVKEESDSSIRFHHSMTSPSFEGRNVTRPNDTENKDEIGHSFNGNMAMSSLKNSSLRKRPPSTRPAHDSHFEQWGSSGTAATAAHSATQDGYAILARSQGVVRSIIPSQGSQPQHFHEITPALLNGSASNNSAQCAPPNSLYTHSLPRLSGTSFSHGPHHYNHTIPPPPIYHQSAARNHSHYNPQGGPYTSSSAPFHPVHQTSATWSSSSSMSQVASSRPPSIPLNHDKYYPIKDSNPKLLKMMKLIEQEDRRSSPEWHQLYRSIPLGSLPSVDECKSLAPPLLKVLAVIPNREVLHRPDSSTSNVQTVLTTKESKDHAPVKAPTLRPNSSTLFCYKKVGGNFHCQIPRIVNGVQKDCDHHPGASHGSNVRRSHILAQHPGVLEAIIYFQTQQRTAIGLTEMSNPQSSNILMRSKKLNAMTESPVPLWNETNQKVALDNLLEVIALKGMTHSAATSQTLKDLCYLLNPNFQFPPKSVLEDAFRKAAEEREKKPRK